MMGWRTAGWDCLTANILPEGMDEGSCFITVTRTNKPWVDEHDIEINQSTYHRVHL